MAIICLHLIVSILVALAQCSGKNDNIKTYIEKLFIPKTDVQVQNLFGWACGDNSGELKSIEDILMIQNQQFQCVKSSLEDIFAITNKTRVNVKNQSLFKDNLASTIESLHLRLIEQGTLTKEVASLLKTQNEKLEALTDLLEKFTSDTAPDLDITSVDTVKLSCPRDFEEFQGKCYKYYENTKVWMEATKICQAVGGFLAEPRTETENNFIKEMIRVKGFTWLGGIDRGDGFDFTWVSDGAPIADGFTNWDVEPFDNRGQGWLAQVMDKEGLWYNFPCRMHDDYPLFAFVCQSPKTPSMLKN